MKTRSLVGACIVAILAIAPGMQGQLTTRMTGTDVLTRMHDKYIGKWFKTLSFSQKTTIAGRGNAEPRVETWYESLEYRPLSGALLRIDQGDLTAGNGVLYTADSSWNVRAGKPGTGSGNGNQFLPLIENVYMQPVAMTAHELEPEHIDMSHVADVTWEGRPAWAVGATSPTDSTSPQFWVDKERLLLVRMILVLRAGSPPYDIHLDDLVETGGGWLATRVTMFVNGTPRQTEEYSGWKTGVTFDAKLFDVNAWTSAKHWAK